MMFKRLVQAAAIAAVLFFPPAHSADLVLATSEGNCTVPLQPGSSVSIDPVTGNVHAVVGADASCPQLAGAVPLSVGKLGTGSGTVSSSPSGINCGSTCTANFPAGTSVSLTAAASGGSAFAGWSGDCQGTGVCSVTMNQVRNVSATFNQAETFTLTVSKSGTGSGTVTSNPTGINCGATCSNSFQSGQNVTLTATQAGGSTFAGWSGACTGTGGCSVTMSQARNVTATFNTEAIAGCTGIVPPAGFTRVTTTSIRLPANTFNVDATQFSRLFRSQSQADVSWPGNGVSRWIRIPQNRYISASFTIPADSDLQRWELRNETSEDSVPVRSTFITVSACPGHFDTTGANEVDSRCRWQPAGASGRFMQIVNDADSYQGFNCPLERGRTYFLNMVHINAATGVSTCSDHSTCSWFGQSQGHTQ